MIPDRLIRPGRRDDKATITNIAVLPLEAGMVLRGQYQLVEEIGKGGMGVVWLAEDTQNRYRWALKFLPAGLAAETRAQRRFRAEAQKIVRLRHPHIVWSPGLEDDGPYQFIRMDYVPGWQHEGQLIRDLGELLAVDGQLTEERVRELLVPILQALHYAHTFEDDVVPGGLVHRDIKPSNILLDKDGTPKLTDFGLARQIQAASSELSGAAVTSGTLLYMSPEQFRPGPVDARSDIYSLGMTIYDMLAGEAPFASCPDIRSCHERDAVPPIAGVSPQMNAMIQKAVAKKPEDRWQSCAEMLKALEANAPPPEPTPPNLVPLEPETRRTFTTAWAWALGALALIGVMAAAVFWGRHQNAGPAKGPFEAVYVSKNADIPSPTPTTPRPTTTKTPTAPPTTPASLVSTTTPKSPSPPTPSNGNPQVESVQILTQAITEGADLEFEVKASDPDQDPIRHYYYKIDGTTRMQSSESPRIRMRSLNAGERILSVKVEDSQGASSDWRDLSFSVGKSLSYTIADESLNIEMLWIPGGSFEMGSSLGPTEIAKKYGGPEEWFNDEQPLHHVELDGFWLSKCEITNAQYQKFNPKKRKPGKLYDERFVYDDASQPVVSVSWEDSMAFCKWLAEKTKMSYSLPTEAQWEYACRAGQAGVWEWGDDEAILAKYANIADMAAQKEYGAEWESIYLDLGMHFVNANDGHVVAAPVGKYLPNGFGLYDMIGNVWEWCRDYYDHEFYGKSQGQKNPINTQYNPKVKQPERYRVLRGGSWRNDASNCRIANRFSDQESVSTVHIGFRIARDSK